MEEAYKLDTNQPGDLQVSKDDILYFPEGLPGFAEQKRFIFLPYDPVVNIGLLQSLDDPNLAFVVGNPFYFFPSYELNLSNGDCAALQVASPTDAATMVIFTLGENLENSTVNLKAPLVFNLTKRIGKQIILDREDYQIKHRLPVKAGEAVK